MSDAYEVPDDPSGIEVTPELSVRAWFEGGADDEVLDTFQTDIKRWQDNHRYVRESIGDYYEGWWSRPDAELLMEEAKRRQQLGDATWPIWKAHAVETALDRGQPIPPWEG
jgi:hypothetical protein